MDQVNNNGEILTTKRNMKVMNKIHLNYVDDLSLAESINLPSLAVCGLYLMCTEQGQDRAYSPLDKFSKICKRKSYANQL